MRNWRGSVGRAKAAGDRLIRRTLAGGKRLIRKALAAGARLGRKSLAALDRFFRNSGPGGEVIVLANQAYLWFNLFTQKERDSFPLSAVALIALLNLGLIAVTARDYFRRFRPIFNALRLIITFSVTLYFFTSVYWAYGTKSNFGVNLTHLDAFYFALGTLTTAGTGNLSAVSQQARAIHALQMSLDFVLIAVVFTLILSRYFEYLNRPKGGPTPASAAPNQDGSEAAPARGDAPGADSDGEPEP